MTPFTTVSSPPVSLAPSCGRKAWSTPAIPLFNAHHAAEPSCRASSSMEASTVSGSASSPPRWRGRQRRKKPASVNAVAAAAGRRRCRSPSPAVCRSTAPIWRAAAVRLVVRRLARLVRRRRTRWAWSVLPGRRWSLGTTVRVEPFAPHRARRAYRVGRLMGVLCRSLGGLHQGVLVGERGGRRS